ncbi:MAG: ribonuclease P protein component [Saccharofermentanales bacterium]|jgi:ribonuclease P protein component
MADALRLKQNRDFTRVYRHGRMQRGRWISLHAMRRRGRTAAEPPRVGFTVNRTIRGAVRRNRAKRLLRESFRLSDGQPEVGTDYIVAARWRADREPRLAELIDEMTTLFGSSDTSAPSER